MRIKMKTAIAGKDFSYSPGDIADIEDEEATRWVDAGHAERVDRTAAKPKAKKIASKPPVK